MRFSVPYFNILFHLFSFMMNSFAIGFHFLVITIFYSDLEPDLDLPLVQVEQSRHLHAPRPAQVAAEVELLLQLQGLVPGVGLPAPLSVCVCW